MPGIVMPEVDRRRTRRRRIQRILTVAVILLLLVGPITAINLWVILQPEQVDRKVRHVLSELLTVDYDLESVSFGLFSGLTLKNLELHAPGSTRHESAVEVEEVHVGLRVFDLLFGQVTIDHVRIDHPRIRIERSPSGEINIFQLVTMRPESRQALQLPELIVNRSEITVCPDTLIDLGEPLEVPLLTIQVPTDVDGAYRITGSVRHPEVRNVTLDATWEPEEERVKAALSVKRITFDRRLRGRLPDSMKELYDAFEPSGTANISGTFGFEHGKFDFESARLDLIGGSLRPGAMEIPIESLSGTAEFFPGGRIEITRPFTGRAGRGNARLGGSLQLGPDGIQDSRIVMELDELTVGPSTRKLLARYERLLRITDQLDPVGRIGFTAEVRGPVEEWQKKIDLKLHLKGMTLTPQRFPYPLRNLTGTLTLESDRVVFDRITGGTEDMPIEISGEVQLVQGGDLDVRIDIQDMPLDRQLEDALRGRALEHYRRFNLGGLASAKVWLSRGDDGKLKQIVIVEGQGVTLKYDLFPYEVEDIKGTVRIDFANGMQFEGIEGRHGPSRIVLERGHVDWVIPGGLQKLDIEIVSPELRIDSDLIAALPANARQAVHDFAPAGKLDTRFEIFREAGEIRTLVTAHVVHPCRVRYFDFQYPLTFKRGSILVDIDTDTIDFVDFETDDRIGPRIHVSGLFEQAGKTRDRTSLHVEFEIFAGKDGQIRSIPGLPVDATLIESLPDDLRNFVERLKIEGSCSGHGSVHYSYGPEDDRAPAADYGGVFHVYDGSIDFGLKFEDIGGIIDFGGRFGPGEPHSFTGTATIGTLSFSRFELADLELLFSYGRLHDTLRAVREGTFAPGEKRFRPGGLLLERLRGPGLHKALQCHIRSGNLYGGNVEGFVYVDVGAANDYYGHLKCQRVDLAQGSRDIFKEDGVTGEAWGSVIFGGHTDDPSDLNGHGDAHVRHGQLRELPAIARVLNPFSDYTEPQYIDTLHVRRFTIHPGRFQVSEYSDLSMWADNLKFNAKGTLDFDQYLELWVDPEVVDTNIVLLRELTEIFNLVPGQRIKLEGPIEDLRMRSAL